MRPTAKAAGNVAGIRPRHRYRASFNEADGQGRRKSGAREGRLICQRSFNEADGQGRRKSHHDQTHVNAGAKLQ